MWVQPNLLAAHLFFILKPIRATASRCFKLKNLRSRGCCFFSGVENGGGLVRFFWSKKEGC